MTKNHTEASTSSSTHHNGSTPKPYRFHRKVGHRYRTRHRQIWYRRRIRSFLSSSPAFVRQGNNPPPTIPKWEDSSLPQHSLGMVGKERIATILTATASSCPPPRTPKLSGNS